MTVNPGWGGQSYIEGSERKVARLAELPPDAVVEVDGGIDPDTAPRCAAAGARLFVAGSFVFGADEPADALGKLARSLSE